MHEKLLKIVQTLETDYELYGKVERGSSDCSCGCRHFVKLAGDVGEEWGVCANPESARAGLLTFEHQGCPEFEPISLDRALTDSQLRAFIAEASEILKRRRERTNSVAPEETPLPDERGEFIYDLKTSYFPHIKGHAPVIFRLEPHDGGFVAVPLASRTTGSQRPTLMGRHPAKNEEVFKIVRANGEYSSERQEIVAALEKTSGKVAGPNGAAALLGMSRSTLQFRMQKLGMSRAVMYR
jgi:hypothetical protein